MPEVMARTEIDAIRAQLASKPRPAGWAARRKRLDEMGSSWPIADDVRLETVDLDGVPGEWSDVPGSDPSRVLLYFHGGGYCSGSIVSHRRLVTEAGRKAGRRTLAVDYRWRRSIASPPRSRMRSRPGASSGRRASPPGTSPSAATAPVGISRPA